MLVSIVTPTYNSEKYIRETFQSISEQSYSNWEWVVTDDCSTDNTFKVLLELSLIDSRVKLFKNDINSGAALTRNKSISESSGDFVAFLDSDDLWDKNKLKEQLDFMQSKGANFSFTSFEIIDEFGVKTGSYVDKDHVTTVTYGEMLRKKATLGCSTVILRKSFFNDIFMPNIRTGQDYALWLKLLKETNHAFLINSVLTLYRITPNSISRNKFKKALRQWEIYRRIERLTLSESIVNIMFYGFRAIFRK
ncbi:glycosyltransferase family 2 protein [Photobacterium sanguinicancri]|uniref:glycosyltransferase family 2 protein n=1 Tax=Photobacterium sanguinicancri TaxID=875932 RepID=UPI0024803CF7|nr:glycosyltransferase family 2 protein [Photobacterium sanguinicancri]